MEVSELWEDNIPPTNDGQKSPINALTFNPSGSRLLLAVGPAVLLYSSTTGDLLFNLKAHKDTVYTVSFSRDGKRFASGSKDKSVIIWSDKAKGILKYAHTTSVQKVVYNPANETLASCTNADFGMWNPDQKGVTKYKVASKILSAAWTYDGQFLALGLFSGLITIRDRSGGEKIAITRTSPIYSLAFSPSKDDPSDHLAVGCWDHTLSFYNLSGVQIGKDKPLGFNICSISYYGSNGDYILVSGSNRKVLLCTRDGLPLQTLTTKSDWTWCTSHRPNTSAIAVGDNTGCISMLNIDFDQVYDVYKDRYAYRDNLTDVIISNFKTSQKVRIKCRDYILGVALYKERLLVRMEDRVHIYDLDGYSSSSSSASSSSSSPSGSKDGGSGSGSGYSYDMHYRIKERIHKKIPCTSSAITSRNIITANANIVEILDYSGKSIRSITLPGVVNVMKADGGPVGSEGIILGCSDGSVCKVYVSNSFHVLIIKQDKPVKALDFNLHRTSLAVVDVDGTVLVYDLNSREVTHQSSTASNVAFNTKVPDMLAYTQDNKLHLKTGSFAVTEQKVEGDVVGYRGSRVYVLSKSCGMAVVDVEQSGNMYRYVESSESTRFKSESSGKPDKSNASSANASSAFKNAFDIACLGVPGSDWRALGIAALKALDVDIAKKAFVRVGDVNYIELVRVIEERLASASASSSSSSSSMETETANNLSLADIAAWEGNYASAAKTYARLGQVSLAIDLYVSLCKWSEAKTFAAADANAGSDNNHDGEANMRELDRRHAQHAEEEGEWRMASELYMKCGEMVKAVTVIGDSGINSGISKSNSTSNSNEWETQMISIVRNIPQAEAEVLKLCADYYIKSPSHTATAYAQEVYVKLNDISSLMALYISRKDWSAAVQLSDEKPGEFDGSVLVPYAEYLAVMDRFDDSLSAYRKAGRPELSKRMMEDLTGNAVQECRFRDAAYYYYLLGKETLKLVKTTQTKENVSSNEGTLRMYAQYTNLSDWYYAYQHVHSFCNSPFTSMQPEMLFRVSLYLLNSMSTMATATANPNPNPPPGISRVSILYTLAQHAKLLGAFKLARFAYERLKVMKVPEGMEDKVDLENLIIMSKPVKDNLDLMPVCYRCGSTNPLLNPYSGSSSGGGTNSGSGSRGGSRGGSGGDKCTNCAHPFIRSFGNFEVLPLVEFFPASDISDLEAIDIIRSGTSSSSSSSSGKSKGSGWKEGRRANADVMTFGDDDDNDNNNDNDDDDGTDDWITGNTSQPTNTGLGSAAGGGGGGGEDPFERAINKVLENLEGNGVYTPVTLGKKTLATLSPGSVYILKPKITVAPSPSSSNSNANTKLRSSTNANTNASSSSEPQTINMRYRYYKNMIPEIRVAVSQPCGRFFGEEEFEFEYLRDGRCPVSRVGDVGDYGSM